MKTDVRTAPPRVLIVDDEQDIFYFIDMMKVEFGGCFELFYAGDIEEAVAQINRQCFDAVVLDMRLPGVSGASIGDLIRENDPNIPMAYLTNLDTEEVRRHAVSNRAYFWLKNEMLQTRASLHTLITLINELVQLNPCIEGGQRLDNRQFPRRLPSTPIQIPPVLRALAEHHTRFS